MTHLETSPTTDHSARDGSLNRYLNAASKAFELQHWERVKAEYPTIASLPPDAAGAGYPDPDMYSWCDELNAIEGVCTLQSCAGHHVGEMGVPDGAMWTGGLWLWLSEEMARTFYRFAYVLSGFDTIERVSVFWQRDGREIVDVSFQGNNSGRLSLSMSHVLSFIQQIRRLVDAGLAAPQEK